MLPRLSLLTVSAVLLLSVWDGGQPARACSIEVPPPPAMGSNESVPPNVVVRQWEMAYSTEPRVILMEVRDEEGRAVPARVQSTAIPASVLNKELFSGYADTVYFYELRPTSELQEGGYSLYYNRNRKSPSLRFTVAGPRDEQPPERPGEAKVGLNTARTYMSYDAACQPIYEERDFVAIEFDTSRDNRTATADLLYEVTWSRHAGEAKDDGGDGGEARVAMHRMPGLPAAAVEGQAGRGVIRVPVWWFKQHEAETGDLVLELRAVDRAGNLGEPVAGRVEATELEASEVIDRIRPPGFVPVDDTLARDVRRFAKAAASEGAAEVFRLLAPHEDAPETVASEEYFAQAVLSRDAVVNIIADVPHAPGEIHLQLPARVEGGRVTPVVTAAELREIMAMIPTDTPNGQRVYVSVWPDGLKAYGRTVGEGVSTQVVNWRAAKKTP